jgi:SOS response associated peptidase (SRAP)
MKRNPSVEATSPPPQICADYMPRFNIVPTQPYFVLKTKYESREAIPATWGLVNSWAKDASQASMCINAKAETIDKLPSFRGAFEKRRCVVPADGFYEWRGPKARREPPWIHPADNTLLLFAGLFEAWQPQPGEWRRRKQFTPEKIIGLLQPLPQMAHALAPAFRASKFPSSASFRICLSRVPFALLSDYNRGCAATISVCTTSSEDSKALAACCLRDRSRRHHPLQLHLP